MYISKEKVYLYTDYKNEWIQMHRYTIHPYPVSGYSLPVLWFKKSIQLTCFVIQKKSMCECTNRYIFRVLKNTHRKVSKVRKGVI